MTWRESDENGIHVLSLEGEIDLSNSPDLREVLKAQSRNRCPILVVDFFGVDYIDSSGLATLVEYFRDSLEYGGKLGLIGLRDEVRTIFEVTRLSEMMPIFPSLEEARKKLPGAS